MTDVSLKEHIETQIRWVDRHFETHIRAIHENTARAAAQIEKRLEAVNAGAFATKEDLKALSEGVDTRLKRLEMSGARVSGMAAIVAIVVSTLTALVVRYLI